MLTYEYDRNRFTITEAANGQDVEVYFHCFQKEDSIHEAFHRIRKHFDENDVIMDAMLYPHHNEEYQWIIRQDFYVDFIVSLFKHQLLTSITWN